MNRIHKTLLMLISMMTIMIIAVGISRIYEGYQARKWKEERYIRYESAQAAVGEIKDKITELSTDAEAIQRFLDENMELSVEAYNNEVYVVDSSGNSISVNTISGNRIPNNTISGNSISGNNISGNNISENDISGNNAVEEILANMRSGKLTLQQRRNLKGSYMETIIENKIDKDIIAQNTVDFSEMKIACLGDSITAASNLNFMEDYQQHGYPARLKDLLGAMEEINLGIGGSSIGRYWDQAFVDRYREIPEDTDIIIVMGGTNDGFCVTEEDIGSLEERAPETFVGDLDELIRGLKENYPQATIILTTPLPNILHDILMKERDYLLPQTRLVDKINYLGEEYDIPVVDLYNSNMLDSHDAANIYNFMPDGVHCNAAGYEILAEHFAAEIIMMYEREAG